MVATSQAGVKIVSINRRRYDPKNPAIYADGFTPHVGLKNAITRYVWSPIIWRGGRRHQSCFEGCRYAVLDIDGGRTMKETEDEARPLGMKFLMAPTRNHMKQKGNKPPCERYRLVLEFEQTITGLRTYRHNMKMLSRRWDADPKCIDGARYFFPSGTVGRMVDGGCIKVFDPPPPPSPEQRRQRQRTTRQRFELHGTLPGWLVGFLRDGRTVGDGRQSSCYAAAIELMNLGINRTEAEQLIKNSPFPRDGFRESEIEQAVRSAAGRI